LVPFFQPQIQRGGFVATLDKIIALSRFMDDGHTRREPVHRPAPHSKNSRALATV
jgi:hypothetical protein